MAPALLFALALAAQPAADEAVATGAKQVTEYELVASCYGALNAHMALQDSLMPELERIERARLFKHETIEEALKGYDEQRAQGQKLADRFRLAMDAAEKASVTPIKAEGEAAIAKGAEPWQALASADPREAAQKWMMWELPGGCVSSAEHLHTTATGGLVRVNAEADGAAEAAPAETHDHAH